MIALDLDPRGRISTATGARGSAMGACAPLPSPAGCVPPPHPPPFELHVRWLSICPMTCACIGARTNSAAALCTTALPRRSKRPQRMYLSTLPLAQRSRAGLLPRTQPMPPMLPTACNLRNRQWHGASHRTAAPYNVMPCPKNECVCSSKA